MTPGHRPDFAPALDELRRQAYLGHPLARFLPGCHAIRPLTLSGDGATAAGQLPETLGDTDARRWVTDLVDEMEVVL